MAVPFWTRGDLNAFFGLGINMLVNVLVLAGLCIGVVHMAPDDVYRVVLPALGIELLIGNLFYFHLARRLAMRERRTDVTAMPYGPSVPHMFIVTLVIMLPTYLATNDPVAAWMAGLAWAFIIGVIILHRRVRRPDDPPPHAARGDARHARWHLAGVHLDAARGADVGRAVDRAAGVHDHPRRLRRRRAAAGQLPGRPGGAARRLGDRLDRRLHGAGRGRRRGRGDRGRRPVAERRPPDRRARGDLAAARHRDPTRHLQLHRGDEQRRERRRRGRLVQPPPRAAGRRHRRRGRRRARLAVPARGLHRPPGLEGGRRPDLLLAGLRRRDLPALCASGCSRCSRRCCRSRRSCRCCCSSAS